MFPTKRYSFTRIYSMRYDVYIVFNFLTPYRVTIIFCNWKRELQKMSLIKNNWALPFHLSPRFSLFPPFFLFFCVASFGRHCRTWWFCERNMADKPSRALVLVGDGLARFISPSHTHLHTLASLACCGFLTLPHSPSQVFAFFFSVSCSVPAS